MFVLFDLVIQFFFQTVMTKDNIQQGKRKMNRNFLRWSESTSRLPKDPPMCALRISLVAPITSVDGRKRMEEDRGIVGGG